MSFDEWLKPYADGEKIPDRVIDFLKLAYEEGIKEGMERAADMLDLNYPLCAKWIRKEIDNE